MPQQAEARHVGAGVHAVAHHRVARRFVERGHKLYGVFSCFLQHKSRPCGCRRNADAERLRQKQYVTFFCAGVCQHLVGMGKARHGQTVLRLVVVNGVTAGDERARLVDLVIAAAQHRVYGLARHRFRHGHDVQAQLRLCAHRIDIRQRVRRRDLAEGVRIVINRREKVHRLHDGQFIGYLVDRRVIALVKAHDQVGVVVYANTL